MERLLRDNLLGAILVSRGLVNEEQLALALQVQEREGGWRKLGDILLDLGYITAEGLSEALEVQRRMAEEVLSRLEGPVIAPQPERYRDRLLVYFQQEEEGTRWIRVLKEKGYLADTVTNSESVLRQLRQGHHALLMLELTKPELIRLPILVRQMEPSVAIVAIVDFDLFRRSRRGLWSAAPYYLLRPFEREELLQVLQHALERRHLRLQNRVLREQMKQYGRELVLLTELGSRLTGTADLAQALTQAMFRVVDIFGSQAGSLLTVDEDSGELRFEVMVGEHVAPIRSLRIPMGQGISGWVAQTGQALLVPDVSKDPRFYDEADRISGFETRSILCVPIQVRGQTIGVIEVMNKADGTSFTSWDQRVLMAISTMVGSAIERDRLRQQLQV